MVILYPKHCSAYGYCRALAIQYKQEYINVLEEEAIVKSIGYIVDTIGLVIEQNNKELFIKASKYLFSLDQISKEEFLEIIKEIGPSEAMGVLFWATQKSENIASLIENNMAFSVKEGNRKQYLEFIKKITLQCARELAAINGLKTAQNKKVTFCENFAESIRVREYAIQGGLEEYKELDSSEKNTWLNTPKQEFKAYCKKEQQKDFFDQLLAQKPLKENIEPATKKFKRKVPNT